MTKAPASPMEDNNPITIPATAPPDTLREFVRNVFTLAAAEDSANDKVTLSGDGVVIGGA